MTLGVVKMTTSGPAGDKNYVKNDIFIVLNTCFTACIGQHKQTE